MNDLITKQEKIIFCVLFSLKKLAFTKLQQRIFESFVMTQLKICALQSIGIFFDILLYVLCEDNHLHNYIRI